MKYNRILVFSTDDHLYPAGGAEQAFGNITERLPHIHFDLVCARLRKGVKKYEEVKNVHIYRIGFGVPRLDGILLALFGFYKAQTLLRKHHYDVLWSIMASYGAFSAVRIKKRYKLPFLLTLQEGDSFEYIYKRVRYVRKQFSEVFKNADAVQAISRYLLAWGKEMGYSGTLGKVIPNGVAVDAFTHEYTRNEIETTRASFQFPKNASVLITSSRLEMKNGIIDVINALPLLPPHVCFVICGSGSLENILKARVAELGMTSRVRFMGFIDPRKLPVLMKASDIFIRPSISEGLGNAFLEAMAARILVIGTQVGGIPDFLTDTETGFMVDIKNPESIAIVVKNILHLDTTTKEKIIDKACAMIVEKYNWDLVSSNMEQMFNEVSLCTQ